MMHSTNYMPVMLETTACEDVDNNGQHHPQHASLLGVALREPRAGRRGGQLVGSLRHAAPRKQPRAFSRAQAAARRQPRSCSSAHAARKQVVVKPLNNMHGANFIMFVVG
jgi:hypothetical protein